MMIILVISLAVVVASYKEAGDRSKIIRQEMLKSLK